VTTPVAPTVAPTVAQDADVQRIQTEINTASEEQDRLRARHHALSLILARRADARVVVAAELSHLSVPDAAQEMRAIERELSALERRIDLLQAELTKADVAAQERIIREVMPEWSQLADEVARARFLNDLRRRGVFLRPEEV
jgi:hypothetical protein